MVESEQRIRSIAESSSDIFRFNVERRNKGRLADYSSSKRRS